MQKGCWVCPVTNHDQNYDDGSIHKSGSRHFFAPRPLPPLSFYKAAPDSFRVVQYETVIRFEPA